jgi:hypothetical protein
MEISNKGLLRQGFIFGFGLIVPLIIGNIVYSKISYSMYSMAPDYDLVDEPPSSYIEKEEDYIKKIELHDIKDTRDGNFVMVTGTVKNTFNKKLSSIKLEAEFFNDKGEFVYEETEYISKNLAPNEVENFAIKCGCTNRAIPEYAKVTVRVVSASNY